MAYNRVVFLEEVTFGFPYHSYVLVHKKFYCTCTWNLEVKIEVYKANMMEMVVEEFEKDHGKN